MNAPSPVVRHDTDVADTEMLQPDVKVSERVTSPEAENGSGTSAIDWPSM